MRDSPVLGSSMHHTGAIVVIEVVVDLGFDLFDQLAVKLEQFVSPILHGAMFLCGLLLS